jgi:AraC-like DNA-binding protein
MAQRARDTGRGAARREPVLAAVLPVERVLFAGELSCVGSFRCGPDHPLFRGGAPSTSCCFVFPRTGVFIQHPGRRRFVADPTCVTFHNLGGVYHRFRLSDDGDRADWFAIARDVLVAAVRARDPGIDDTPARPFRFERGPCDAATYLAQRRLFQSLASPGADAAELEERVFLLLDEVLGRAYAANGHALPVPNGDRDCVELARAVLARRFAEPSSLSRVAAAAGVSVPHLCRSFMRRTGATLSSHRLQLRLRASLERVAAGEDLSAVAFDLGFSSHSHFTACFRVGFGLTPSAVRGWPVRRLRGLAEAAPART